jgi:putative Ca2+/H+ antiporter (TMEM165/GDT1 family)
MLLSSKTKNRKHLLLGIILAFLIVQSIGILLGSWITALVPEYWLKTSSAIIFILYGILTLKNSETSKEEEPKTRTPFLTGFSLIFATEWGDKTQIAATLFATKYNPALVLLGSMTALTTLSTITVWLGNLISQKINQKTITQIAGFSFILIGISFLIT